MAKQIKAICAILFAVSLQFGCIKAPLEFTLDKEVLISEADVKMLAEKIYDNLAELDFSHPAGSPATFIAEDECIKAYRFWLRERFDEGLLPTGIILPKDYAKSSSNPLIYQCRAIDFGQEYKKAAALGAKNTEREGLLFDPSEIRKALVENKCIENIFDPDQEKLEITGMSLLIRENTLSVKAPTYKIYTSNDYLTQDVLSEKDAEELLVKNGTLMLLGETEPIGRHFVGKMPVKLIEDYDAFWWAEGPAVSLEGTILAAPNTFGGEPEKINIGGKEYYAIPKGMLRLTLGVNVNLKGKLIDDGLCAFREFKNQIREDEKKRKENR